MNQYFIRYKNLILHSMVIVLGFTGILGELISIKSIDLVWYRMLFSFIALFIFIQIKNELFTLNKRTTLELILIGFIVALHWIFFFESIKISVPIGVISLSASSLFTSLLEPLMLKKKFYRYEVILGIIIILAFFMMYNTANESLVSAYIYGIISAFLATLFTIFNAKYVHKVTSYSITMIEMLGGVILISLYFLFTSNLEVFSFNIEMMDLIYLLILSIICTSLVFALMTEIMKYITPYTLVMAVNLEPIYAIILSFILLPGEEPLNIYFYVGCFLIISCIYLDHYFKNNRLTSKI